MTKDEIKKKTEEVFTFLYRKGVSPSFRFPKGYGASIIDSFADTILERERGMVGVGIIVDYCIHQTHLWRDAERWDRFNITWAFGPKGIDRFYNSKTGTRYYQNRWLDYNDWDRDTLKSMFTDIKDHPLKKFVYIEAEDTTKARFVSTEAGLGLCIILTTLYTPHSPVCGKCKNKDQCEAILKKRDPELLRVRNTTEI